MGYNHTENTASFEKLKTQIQEAFNFAISVDYGIAALKLQLGLLEKGTISNLPRPEFYKGDTTPDKLRSQTHGYKNQLSKYLYLSSFSFFESYLGNVIRELADRQFSFLNEADIKSRTSNSRLIGAKRILNSDKKPEHDGRYKSKSEFLRGENYLPSKELWIDTSLKIFLKKVDDLKANEIPSFLITYLYMDLDEGEITLYGEYRALRNDIAHGDEVSIGLNKVQEMNSFFKGFAKKIDKHLRANFILPKNYKEESKTP